MVFLLVRFCNFILHNETVIFAVFGLNIFLYDVDNLYVFDAQFRRLV